MQAIPEELKKEGMRFVLLEKSGKKPFQQKWQNKNIAFDDPELIKHIEAGGNYGVMGGGQKNLVIVDFDNKELQEKLVSKLPETFTVKTGGGLLHKYFISDDIKSFKIFDEEMNTLLDVQGDLKQVVGPGSKHPNGKIYEITDDKKIAFIPYAELKALILPFDRKPKKKIEEKIERPRRFSEDTLLEDLRSNIPIEKVLLDIGVDTSKNPSNCPFHDSKGGKCLGWEREVAHCFHCDGSWNIFSLIKSYNNSSFTDALEWLCDKYGFRDQLIESREKYKKSLVDEKDKEFENIRQEYLQCISGKDKNWGQASEVIVRYLRDNNYIYTTKSDLKPEMWIYKEGIYVDNGKFEIKETLRKILKQNFSEYISNMVISKIQMDTAINSEELFNKNYIYLVPVQNGILNILTKELNPFDPKKIFFNKLPVTYNPSASFEKIEKFLEDVLSMKEDVKVLYELFGFSLLGEYRFEKAFMFVGEGRNGKGKTIELIKRFIAAENCASIPLSLLIPESFSISELFRKRLNLAGDICYQDLKETSTFKGLTGRDLIGGKRKFLPNIYFENYAKMVFACNELPMVYDTSRGFWDRWVLLEFPHTFVSQKEYSQASDKTNLKIRKESIIDEIVTPEEMSGLLNKALEGLKRLIERKEFSVTVGSKEIKDLWIRKANSFMAFASDSLEEDYDSIITKRELRKRYSRYCKKHNVHSKSDYVIKKVLNEEFGVMDEYIKTGINTNDFYNTKQEWVWRGVKWKN